MMITLAELKLSEDRMVVLDSDVSNELNGKVSKRLYMIVHPMPLGGVSYAIYQGGKLLLTSKECNESLLEIYNAI